MNFSATYKITGLNDASRCRNQRRNKLAVLWFATIALLLGQAAVAYMSVDRYKMRHKLRSEADLQVEKARMLLAQGKRQAAQYHLEGVLVLLPTHSSARALLAKIQAAPYNKTTPPIKQPLAVTSYSRAGKSMSASAYVTATQRQKTTPAKKGKGVVLSSKKTKKAHKTLIAYKSKRNRKNVRDRLSRKARSAQSKRRARPVVVVKKKRRALPSGHAKVRDVTVPRNRSGNASRGGRIFRLGCGLCHGRNARRVNPSQYNPRQWKRYFASSRHGRHTLLRSNFTQSDLADVKAYLINNNKSE